MQSWFMCGAAVLAVAGQGDAQPAPPQEQRNVRVVISQPGPDGGMVGQAMAWVGQGTGPMDFDVLGGPIGFDGGVIKDAPYCGEAVTEMVQTLADGNRIVRQTTAAVYRDGAGRTRRETGLTVLGPLVAGPDAARQVVITDPEAGVTYVLDATARTARRIKPFRIQLGGPQGSATAGVEVGVPPGAPPPPPPPPPLPPPPPGEPGSAAAVGFSTFELPVPPPPPGADGHVMFRANPLAPGAKPVTESLGVQLIEGVSAEGTRTVMTIPAGQIGNDRPIEIVSERWYSPELKALVLSRHVDPRFGETTYHLSNIVLGEPSASLFEVPPDFEVVDAPQAGGRVMYRREVR
jgi:hypothetical protein